MGKVSLFIAWDVQLIVGFNKVSGRVDSVKPPLHAVLISLFEGDRSSNLCSPLMFALTSPPNFQQRLDFSSPPVFCYLPSHKTDVRLMWRSVWLCDSDCVILNMSHWFKVCKDLCVCLHDYSRCVCVCLRSRLVCETGVIELRGFSVFGGRGEIGIFRIH